MSKTRKLVMGVGINDADYVIAVREELGKTSTGKRSRKTVWRCPFYARWLHMLSRCYDEKIHSLQPTYRECSVCSEWLTFSNFKAWMETQDWEDKQLDKDLLVPGNKVYGPDTCVFVSRQLNTLFTDSVGRRGDCPKGVCFDKRLGKYLAQVSINGATTRVGHFDTQESALAAYQKAKDKIVLDFIEKLSDKRLVEALSKRLYNVGGE